jgi:hypothetical protein
MTSSSNLTLACCSVKAWRNFAGPGRWPVFTREPCVSELGEHAAVLGAGMAGLLAARMLSEFYDSVTVVERDRLPDYPSHRRGVPQCRHLHTFLSWGTQVLAELFPALLDQLAAAGAVVVNDGDLSRIYVCVGRGELKRSGRLADRAVLALCLASRPFLEFHVRRRVQVLTPRRYLTRWAIPSRDGCHLSGMLSATALINIRVLLLWPRTLAAPSL